MTKRTTLIAFRLILGVVTLVAILRQFGIQIQLGFSAVNFFSYFTNLSNTFAAIVLIVAAIRLARDREPTVAEDLIRGASVVGMAIVGIVFALLLRSEDLGSLLPWVNTVLHYIMPVAVVLDWLYQPPRSSLSFRQTLVWLIFPLLYLSYVLIRGSIVGWYPYPFLDPANVGGYVGVAGYSLGIVVVFLFVAWVLMMLGNRRKRYVAA
jgi:hypothetical protein